jgi:lysophospholipase L1-like esterase
MVAKNNISKNNSAKNALRNELGIPYLEAAFDNQANLSLKKIYGSIAEMEADAVAPIGDDGEFILVGQLVVISAVGADMGKAYRYKGGEWEYVVTIGDLSQKFDTFELPGVLSNNSVQKKVYNDNGLALVNAGDFKLQKGGGRLYDTDYDLILISASNISEIRIIGTTNIDGYTALWGFYLATPEATTPGVSIATSLVSDGNAEIEGKTHQFDTVIYNNSNAPYLYLSVREGCSVRAFGQKDDFIYRNHNSIAFNNTGFLTAAGAYVNYPEGTYRTTDFINIGDYVKGSNFHNLLSDHRIGVSGLSFFDTTFSFIGFYKPIEDVDVFETIFDVSITQSLTDVYPNAKYIRATSSTAHNAYVTPSVRQNELSENRKIAMWNDNHRVFNMISKILCGGDSVTQGFVVDGAIYEVMSEYSYPSQLQKLIPQCTITNAGLSGITPILWLANVYPTHDFTEFDLFILELGYNGGLNVADIDTPGTQTYAYKQIVSGARAQNANLVICLTLSSRSNNSDSWVDVLESLSAEFNCKILDLRSKKYLNLSLDKYHGSNEGVMDYVHFNKKGYNAKAWFIYNILKDIL